MHTSAATWSNLSCALAALFCSFAIHSDSIPHSTGRLASLPPVTLWAWERREDLHALDTHRFAVAYLDQTLTVGPTVERQPRRNPLVIPASATRIPVVRIEAAPGAVFDQANLDQLVADLLLSADQQGIAALQVDFDATRSQRAFYRDLLVSLHRQLPAGLPLSITALASWCSFDDWLRDLPIDEAVPMMFRMEPDRYRAPAGVDDFQVREPLCLSSVGVSTNEPWPDNLVGKRIYVFPDNGWHIDSPADIERRLQ